MDRYIVLDLETTGFSQNTDEIIDIGAWKIENGVAVEEFSTLVKPRRGIPYEVQKLTGIVPKDLICKPCIEEVLDGFCCFCGDLPLLGHNLQFDYKFLKQNCENLALDFTNSRLRSGLDTLKIARKYFRSDSYKLENLVKKFELIDTSKLHLHRARVDAYLTHLLYQRMCLELGEVSDIVTPVLLEEKVHSKKEVGNCESLNFK